MEKRGIGFQVDALLAPEQARTLYFAHARIRSPQVEFVPIERAAGRTLAQRAVADAEYPAAPRSAMDGFAVRAADTPGRLTIAGEIRTGHAWPDALTPGTALRIATGGVVPAGADSVVPIEDVRLDGERIAVEATVPPGDCVTPAGSDMRAGELLVESGTRIGGRELGVLATLGMASVPVFKRPVVAVVSSGDELVHVRSTPGPGQVRDSNRWAIAGTLKAMGVAVRHFPTARDEPGALEALLREALAMSDAIVLTGGSSVGERDFAPHAIDRLGAPGVIVHGLRVKPGKPTVLACIDGKPVIGLPGNPASALMILEAVAEPIIGALSGTTSRRATTDARLGAPTRKRLGWTWYVPVRLDEAGALPIAYPLELRSSSVSLLARASGFLVLDETLEGLAVDVPVRVVRFAGS